MITNLKFYIRKLAVVLIKHRTMQKFFILTFIFTILFFSSLHAKSLVDSVGVENLNGKKVILHKIDPQETYYALGRKYNVAPKDIISFNDNKSLVPGIIVKVPTQLDFAANVSNPIAAQEHTVKARESLYIIANLYGTTVQVLKDLNNLSSNNLSIGQRLKIPGTAVAGTTPSSTLPVQNPTPSAGTNAGNTAGNTVPVPATNNRQTTQSMETIEHTVKAREFLGKIATDYNTTVEAIKAANNLTNNNLRIGQVLKIPGRYDVIPSSSENNSITGTHTVAAGETVFNISQRYGITAYQLREANNMSNNTLNIGQVLSIPAATLTTNRSITETARINTVTFPDSVETIQDPNMRRDPGVYGLNQVEEKGAAVWIDDPDLDSSKMLVLHRTLPIGTVIMVKNPMVNISTFAKVVGKFTENETTKDVIIVVTKAVAEKLGVHDKRFFCNITYATQENGQ